MRHVDKHKTKNTKFLPAAHLFEKSWKNSMKIYLKKVEKKSIKIYLKKVEKIQWKFIWKIEKKIEDLGGNP